METKKFNKFIALLEKGKGKDLTRRFKGIVVRQMAFAVGLILALFAIAIMGVLIGYFVMDNNIGMIMGFAAVPLFGCIVLFFYLPSKKNPFTENKGYLRALSMFEKQLKIEPMVKFSDKLFKEMPTKIATWSRGTYDINNNVISNSDVVLERAEFSPEQAEAFCTKLVALGHLEGSEILEGKSIVRKEFGIDKKEARAQGKGKSNKKIVLDLSEVEENSVCDNCGSPFQDGDLFCGFCATKRKDIRRRV